VTIVRELESAGEECLLEVKLSGFDETFLLRLPEHLVTPAAGETWMAVGLRQSRDAETAQGLRPGILCRWLWPLDKP
jgi:hypothetical protein